MNRARNFAERILHAVIPDHDREWLRALLAEVPSVERRSRVHWLMGGLPLLSATVLRRLAVDAWLAPVVVLFGLLLARLHLESGVGAEPATGFFLMRFLDPPGPSLYAAWLMAAIALIVLLRPGGTWRWALLAGLCLPFLVFVLSIEGRYFQDRVDAFYPMLPLLLIALCADFARWLGFRRRYRATGA